MTVTGPGGRIAAWLCAVTLVLASMGAQVARAGIVDSFQSGGWSVNAYTDDGSGAFDTCVASAAYRSGITMYVQVDTAFNWALGFSAPTWRMTPGAEIPLQYRFDRGPWQQGLAVAASETLARMQMPADGYIVTRFRRGRVMYVYDGAYSYEFRLTGTSRLMQRMVTCVETNAARYPGGGTGGGLGQPQAGLSGGSGGATPGGGQDGALAIEATQALFNIMSRTGLALPLVPDGQRADPDLNGLHAVAASGNRTIVAHVLPPNTYESAQALMSTIVADSAKACADLFSSGTAPVTEAGKALLTSVARCDAGDVTTDERVVLVPRAAGGLYIFGVQDIHVGEGGGAVAPLAPLPDASWYAATAAAAQ